MLVLWSTTRLFCELNNTKWWRFIHFWLTCCGSDKILTYFEEEEQKSSLYGLNMLGYTCATRVNTVSYVDANSSKSYKNYLSSDCRLKLVYMKSESLVIVNNHVTVNDLSNFAHTAHHARRVVTAVNVIEG